ncbi:MAG: Gfo/Idh/MocA family oxidoreductase, partial [Bdellovibrionaceae bacterium]|nr:Gfo/Idh/MocA family oxidoreductase [Pseudobdellovibrionaceae bacterium]
MMSKLRAAVVGVGYLGRFHAQKYKNNTAAELVAVCDGRLEQAQNVAQELGVKAVKDPRELIGQVDLVTVAASTQAHYDLGLLFLEAGIP